MNCPPRLAHLIHRPPQPYVPSYATDVDHLRRTFEAAKKKGPLVGPMALAARSGKAG